MTREKARKILEIKRNTIATLGGADDWVEALDMGIKALSVLENTDPISREKALEMVEKNKHQIAIYRAIEALPSADMREVKE